MAPIRQPITRPSIYDQLLRVQHDLDRLLRDASLIRSTRDYDALEERAQAIAASVTAPFRGAPPHPTPSAPPLAIETQADRACAWY